MKKKHFSKKLTLNKMTISRLNPMQMRRIYGADNTDLDPTDTAGSTITVDTYTTCRTQVCPIQIYTTDCGFVGG